ncbi:MAG: aldo/keto reductase [Lachnospiraceae bacterium]
MIENDSIKLPDIGYGTFPYKDALVNSIPKAYKAGYRLVDTSDNYGNEEYTGAGIKELRDCILITKFSQPLRAYEVEKCFRESSEKLTRTPDIYLLHWPYPFLWKRIWKQMEELYLKGECKAIGVCNFEGKKIKQLLKVCRVKPYINQIERHPMFQQREIVEFCNANGIRIMSYSPVARQNGKLHDQEILKMLAEKYGKSINQIILNWNVVKGTLPIPASKSEKHIKENIDIFDFDMTDEEIAQIDALEANMRIRFDPNKRFTNMEKLRFFLVPIKQPIKKIIRTIYGQ